VEACCSFGLIELSQLSRVEVKGSMQSGGLFDDVNAECRGIGAWSVPSFQRCHFRSWDSLQGWLWIVKLHDRYGV
jgi:hypothetical protein